MRLRPPAPADAEAVTALVVAVDVAEAGEADYTLADLREEWEAPGFDVRRDAVLAEADGLVGYAAFRGARVLMSVLPEHAAVREPLLDWCERRARERGHDRYEQAIAGGDAAAEALLRARGYAAVRSYWRMDRVVAGAAEPDPPPGITLRALRARDRLYALHQAAFAGQAYYDPVDEATFDRRELNGHDLDRALSRVAERDGGPVGFALVRRWPEDVAYLALIAVHPDAAGAGIGGTLLCAVFAAAAQAGLARVRLTVASDNPGATRLYERHGMTPIWRVDAYARPVLPD
jgi:mycothiol synthase